MTSTKRSPVLSVADGDGAVIEAVEAIDSQNDTATGRPAQARWDAANPKARWAHAALRSAIRRGLVVRKPCEVCGNPETDGHHPDYDKPLQVRWLCRLHHRAVHSEGGVE